jgi:hypothetical protein
MKADAREPVRVLRTRLRPPGGPAWQSQALALPLDILLNRASSRSIGQEVTAEIGEIAGRAYYIRTTADGASTTDD